MIGAITGEGVEMKVQRSIEIAAPPEKIWPFLVEPDNILKWCITLGKRGELCHWCPLLQ